MPPEAADSPLAAAVSSRVTPSPSPTRVLIVDDEDAVSTALSRFLRTRGYDAFPVSSGAEALDRIREERFQVVLCDIRMPVMSGLDVLTEALAIDGDLAVIMLTGVNEATTATTALARGAMDYLVKPVELVELERAVIRVAHRRRLEIERRKVEMLIRDEVAARSDELESEKNALRALALGIAETLINAMEAKDVYLRGHSQRVADLAASIAELLGLSADVVENVRLAGRLHDVGKIGIREEILNKPGPLTPEEFDHVKDHVRIGMEILAPLKHMPIAFDYVRDHHEHFDGTGYPRGLAGDEITIGGRILAACDAYDALTSRRAFREAMSSADTLAHLENFVGTLLDPEVFNALSRIVRRRKTLTFIDPLGQ